MNVANLPVPPVVRSVTVRVAPALAFEFFARDLARWWPLAHFRAGVDPVACTLEPRVGGRVFERAASGEETDWGTVLAYEPPYRLAFSWTVGVAPEQAQTIEVRFTAAQGGTRVELTHSGWEKLGEAAAQFRDMYENGWVTVLDRCFVEYANAH
jgi:uncharacterized protein YndB with AHSA1/START domain